MLKINKAQKAEAANGEFGADRHGEDGPWLRRRTTPVENAISKMAEHDDANTRRLCRNSSAMAEDDAYAKTIIFGGGTVTTK